MLAATLGTGTHESDGLQTPRIQRGAAPSPKPPSQPCPRCPGHLISQAAGQHSSEPEAPRLKGRKTRIVEIPHSVRKLAQTLLCTRPPGLGFPSSARFRGAEGPAGSSVKPTWPGTSKTLRAGRLPPPGASGAILRSPGAARGLSRHLGSPKPGARPPKLPRARQGRQRTGTGQVTRPSGGRRGKQPPLAPQTKPENDRSGH